MVLQKQVDMFIFSYANQNHDTYKKVLPTKYQMCFDTKIELLFKMAQGFWKPAGFIDSLRGDLHMHYFHYVYYVV